MAHAVVATLVIGGAMLTVATIGERLAAPLINETSRILSVTMGQSLKHFVLVGDWFGLDRSLSSVNELIAPLGRFAVITADGTHIFPESLRGGRFNEIPALCQGREAGCDLSSSLMGGNLAGDKSRIFLNTITDKSLIESADPKLITEISVLAFDKLVRQVLLIMLTAIALATLLMGLITTVITEVSVVGPMRRFVHRISSNSSGSKDFAAPLSKHETQEIRAGREAVGQYLARIEQQEIEREDMFRRQTALEKESAIARMTGMLAHDVRKPFSILRMGLNMLGNAKDPDRIKAVLAKVIPEVDRAVRSVDGLISDVMEIGSGAAQLIQEAVAPEALIEAAINDICRVYPTSKVSLTYELSHISAVHVHVQKVARVFSNIFGNAVQAMGYQGEAWFKTREVNGFVEYCIGNSGSMIPPENISKLFEAFFTSGKKGGTGLGLAIAQKVVTAHGGTIWCESSTTEAHPNGKVEFYFTLPISNLPATPFSGTLPSLTSDVLRSIGLAEVAVEAASATSVSKGETELEVDIVAIRNELGRPISILIVDDEEVYRSGLQAALSRTPEVYGTLAIAFADGSEAALSLLRVKAFDLVISDVDLGIESKDGFELVAAIREAAEFCLICVHSNRMVAADHKTAIESGADAFLPKPMAREHLLKLVLQSAEQALLRVEDSAPIVATAHRPEIAVVEDNVFMLEAWEETLRLDSVVHAADSPEALLEKLNQDPDLLERLSLVITDYNFDNSSKNGADLGRMLKHRRPGLQVFLSSDGAVSAAEIVDSIDRVITKEPVAFGDLVT